VRKLMILGLLALPLSACGGSADTAKRTAVAVAAKPQPRTLIVVRRIRYEGATIKVMDVRADGSLKLKVPNGGAGGANFEGRLTPKALRAVRRAIARTAWSHLPARRVLLDHSGGYYMLHYGGKDYVAMSDGMSAGLFPLVSRLDGIYSGEGLITGEWQVVHRFGRI
jgi:hypothetical protein